MKKLYSFIISICLICACLTPVWANEPAFSSIAYLTEEQAASRLAYYTGTPEKEALEKIHAATQQASNGAAGLLGARNSPAYVYMQTDIGKGNLIELGAIVIVSRKNGKLEFSQVIGTYSRPVNTGLKWTPDAKASGKINDKTQLALSASGTASIPLQNPEHAAGNPLLDAGFTLDPAGKTFIKKATVSAAYPLTEAIPLGESDIARGYIAMFDYFAKTTRQNLREYPRVALELKNPVGMTATSKVVLMNWLAQQNGEKAIEMTMEEYFGSSDTSGYPADCLFIIDKVTVSGNTIRYKIHGYMGGQTYILSDCMVQKGANGWEAVNTAPPGSEASRNPMIGQKVS